MLTGNDLLAKVQKLASMDGQQTFQKHFVDLGQTLYIEWLKTCTNMQSATEQERREIFKFAAEMSFEAAEEFSKVFCYQEDN
jgi:hypothetical protein